MFPAAAHRGAAQRLGVDISRRFSAFGWLQSDDGPAHQPHLRLPFERRLRSPGGRPVQRAGYTIPSSAECARSRKRRYLCIAGVPPAKRHRGFASNGYGAHSPGAASAGGAGREGGDHVLLLVILGATDKRAPAGLAPIASASR
jgi:hypothetical protein